MATTYTPQNATLKSGKDLAAMYNVNYDVDKIKGILDAATKATYVNKNDAFKNTENKYYQSIDANSDAAVDAMRRANASSVATGAAKGTAAANQLSTLLGLQQASVAGASDLANQRNALNTEEAAAYLTNASTALNTSNDAGLKLGTIGSDLYNADVQQNVGNASYWAALAQAAAEQAAAAQQANATRYAADRNLDAAGVAASANTAAQNAALETAQWMKKNDPIAYNIQYRNMSYADAKKAADGEKASTTKTATTNPDLGKFLSGFFNFSPNF